MGPKQPLKIAVLLLGIGGVIALSLVLPIREWMLAFTEWVRGFGPSGAALYAAVYLVVCLVVPASILTLGAGFLFGLPVGFVVVSVGSVGVASIAFLIARFLARGWVEKRVAANPKFAALDEAVARNGWKIVVLTRLSPIFPFLFLNYAYGLTRVRFRDYFFASWIGMVPGTLLFVYAGTLLTNLAEIGSDSREKTTGEIVFYWAGLGLTVIATAFITRIARKALQEKVRDLT